MFDGKTVIILGAGTSADFGLPLGKELWRGVRQSAASCADALLRLRNKHPNGTPQGLLELLVGEAKRSDPKRYCLLLALNLDSSGASSFSAISEFVNLLDSSNVHASVDDFTKDNPSVAAPVSALVAGILFELLYDNHGDEGWKRKTSLTAAELTDPRDSEEQISNWVRMFVGLCRAKIQTQFVGRLTVVSFNYDRLFETIAREVWNRAEREYPDFDQCIEMVYPYGVFESLDLEVSDANDFVSRQQMAFALAGGATSNAGVIARTKIHAAERLFLCGFSCAESAIDLLKLAQTDAQIFAQNYGGDDLRLDRVLIDRLRVPPRRVENDGMSTLVSSGFFEQR